MMRSRRATPEADVAVTAPERLVLDETGESPTVEVRVWRHGKLIHRELCESAEIAADIVKEWSELEDVECVVDDLAGRHSDDEAPEDKR